MPDAPLISWLEAAPRTRLPTPQRLELELLADGVRVMVSVFGTRSVGCTVPWERLRELREDPFPSTIRRCSALLIERYGATPQVPATETTQVPAGRPVTPVPATETTQVPAGRHDQPPQLHAWAEGSDSLRTCIRCGLIAREDDIVSHCLVPS